LKTNQPRDSTIPQLKSTNVNQGLTNILQASNNGKTCGSFLFDMETNRKLEKTKPRFSQTDEERNKAMIMHVKIAALNENNRCTSLCHVLAANFMALEAYVSFGSVSQMMLAQNGLKSADMPATLRTPSQNELVDYALMNFGYGVEHYFEALTDNDPVDAFDKLGKYTQRLYNVAQHLATSNKNCWNSAFTNLGLTNVPSNAEKTFFIDHFKNNQNKIIPFIKEGYNCVASHAMILS